MSVEDMLLTDRMDREKDTTVLQRIWKARYGYFFAAPGYLAFLLFLFVPLLAAIGLSFFDATPLGRTWTGLENYQHLFTDKVMLRVLGNTIEYVVILVPAVTLLALFLALLIFSFPNWLQSVFRSAFYLPGVTGGVIMSVVWLWIFNPTFGLLNYLLSLVNVEPVLWLASAKTALFSVAVVVLAWSIGQPLIIFLAALGGISQEVHDAALVDGANSWQRAIYITVPLLRPSILFVVATQTIYMFQIWEAVYMLTNGGPSNTSASVVFKLYQVAFINGKYGLASAMGTVLMLIIVAVTLVLLRFWGDEGAYD